MNAELPPLVAPFRGERYAAKDVSALIAPPYDVISSEDRARFAARDPHNIVHLILPEAPSGRGGSGDRYAQAATLLKTWREAGVVRPDPADSVYIVAQDYAVPSGERRTRIGMLGAVRAEPFATRRVRPHEQTHSAPKADRLALLRATAANLESIFLLAPDPDRLLAQALVKRSSGVPAVTATRPPRPMPGSSRAPTASSRSSCRRPIRASPFSLRTASSSGRGAMHPN